MVPSPSNIQDHFFMRKFLWSVCFLGMTMIGCGSSSTPITPEQEQHQALSQVGELYRLYTFENKKPPSSIDDFAPQRSVAPKGLEALKTGEVVVFMGANMTALEEGPPSGTSDEVLAYEKSVPESGGTVMMLDRSVKHMTAEEFKAAKKAGKGL
jgi:hypothetical protein